MNFIYYMPDEMRADSVSCYGNTVCRMPGYDKLAEEGTLFENCYVQNPVCSPSRCCITTGLYPHNAGHRTLWHLVRSHEPNLFQYLRDAGYQIIWFGKNDMYSGECIDMYADEISGKQGGHEGPNIHGFGEVGFFDFLRGQSNKTLKETHDGMNVMKAIDFIRNWKEGDRPFFLFLPLAMPHPQYAAPDQWHDLYETKDIEPLYPKVREGKPSYYPLIEEYRNLRDLPEEEFRKIKAVYYGMNSAMDALFTELMDAVDESGRRDDTTVFITSDHGDYAGDYGLVEKWPNAFEDCLAKVPFIVRTPGGAKGHRVKEPIESFDLLQTVLDLAGIESKHTHFSRSLVPQLMGEAGDPDRAVFSEGGYNPNEPQCFEGWTERLAKGNGKETSPEFLYGPKMRQQQEHPESVCRATMMRWHDWKLVYRANDVSELYDLRNDPMELDNLYGKPEHAAVRAELLMKMLSWLQSTSDTVPMTDDHRGFADCHLSLI